VKTIGGIGSNPDTGGCAASLPLLQVGIHPDGFGHCRRASFPCDEVDAGENDAKRCVGRIARSGLDCFDGWGSFCSRRRARCDAGARYLMTVQVVADRQTRPTDSGLQAAFLGLEGRKGGR
jgi:hypothetical protein